MSLAMCSCRPALAPRFAAAFSCSRFGRNALLWAASVLVWISYVARTPGLHPTKTSLHPFRFCCGPFGRLWSIGPPILGRAAHRGLTTAPIIGVEAHSYFINMVHFKQTKTRALFSSPPLSLWQPHLAAPPLRPVRLLVLPS